MDIDSEKFEGVGRIRNLNLVGGLENTAVGIDLVTPMTRLVLGFEGITSEDGEQDRHWGAFRIARSYQVGKEMRGAQVGNERQVSVVSEDDLFWTAHDMDIIGAIERRGLDVVNFMSRAVAANVVIENVDYTTYHEDYMGPSSRLYIGSAENAAVVAISENHLPCSKPANAIAKALDLSAVEIANRYKKAATRTRGYMGWVWAPGIIRVGDPVSIQLPVDFKGRERFFWSQEEK